MKTKLAGRRSRAELRLGAAGLVVLLTAGAVVVLPSSVAQAATDVVTNCSGSLSVLGSLPYELNNAGSGDVIAFALSPPCATITPASTISISQNLTIAGPGADALAVSGGGTQQVFQVGGGTVTISGLTIEDGNAGGGDGGGIDNFATLTVADSTLSNDTADFGGGIENSGTLTVSGSTLSNDTAAHSGGGIESDSAAMTVTNTTFSQDSTGTGEGGGVDMFDGSATITNSTFSADSAPSYFGGGLQDDQGDLSMGATIVANSPSGNDCFLQLPIGTFTDLGNNLDDDGTCHLTAGSDLPSTPPGFDPSGLEDNGGPTQTVALAAGSAAINHISNAPQCPATDQRGSPRNVPCDIGAYDTNWGPAVTIAITGSQTSGEGSSLTYTTDAPAGVVSGTLTCTTVNGGTPISPSLPVGYYSIDGSSCSGLSSSNQATYAVFPSSYAGVFVVSPSPSWSVSPSPDPGTGNNVFSAVSCTSVSFCQAVGYQAGGGAQKTLIETWDGSTWSVDASPSGSGFNDLDGVSCTSPTFCMAVGSDGGGSTNQTLAERWNGSSWTITTTPDQGGGNNFLNGVSCTSATACVAVGYDQSTATGTEIETWNGTSWSLATSVDPSGTFNELTGVSCTSATACVAVGLETGSINDTLIETLSGGTWSLTTSPSPGSAANRLNGVSCTSATACVAAGQRVSGSVGTTLVETLAGGTWSLTTSPNRGSGNNSLNAVTCISASSCEAAGGDTNGALNQTVIESWNGTTWALATTPSPGADDNALYGISCVTTTGCAATGLTATGEVGTDETLVETPTVPVVSEVSPSAGATAGGDTVTITGSGFTGATAVDFGGTPATVDSATGDTTLTVTDPAGAAGTVDVTVTAPGGVSAVSPADQFTYTVVQTTPTTAPCTPTCTTNTVSTPLNNTSVSVDGASGNSNPDATTNLLINTTTLNCGSSKAHNYDYLTAVSTLSTTDFATGQVLTVTETIGSEPSTKGVKVCYAASSTATSGTFLKKCKPSMKAPCVKTLAEVSGNVVATLLVPATDPRFWAGDGALDVTSFSPTKGSPGTTVTIKGKNLSQIRSVVIGGAVAPMTNQSTATKVVVTVPSTAARKAGVITVTGASGEAVSAKLFTVTSTG